MKEDRAKSGQFAALRQWAEEVLRRQPEELREMPPEDIQYLVHELQVHQIELEMQNEELRRTQRELELSRDRYSDRYDFAPMGHFILSETGLIQQANLTTVTMLGVERGRLIKQPLTRFIAREDQDIYYLHRRKLFETQEPQVYEMRMVREDGSQFWARIDAAVALDSEGQALCRATMSDITERKQAREALAETTRLLETILDRTHVLVAYLDPHFNFVRVNRAYAEADEREASFFPGKNHFDLYPDAENEEIFRRVVETGEPYFAHAKPFEYAERPERGVSYWDWSLVPTQDPVGAVTGLVFTLENVTDRVRMNVALQESERRFQLLFEEAPIAYQSLDEDGHIIAINKTWIDLLGYSKENSIGRWFGEFIAPGQRDHFRDCFAHFKADGEVHNMELEVVQSDGSHITALFDGTVGHDECREFQQTYCTLRDITERKRAEEALQESEERFRQLAETVQDAFWLGTPGIGEDRQVIYVNPAFEEIFGVGREEIYKSDNAWLEAVYEEDRNRALGLLEGFLPDQNDYDVEYRIVQPDGSIRWIWARGFDIRSEKGEIYRTAGLAQDITERKQAEEKLRHRTKELEALRQMGLELAGQLDVTALLHSVVFRAMELLDGNATGLALYDAEHDILKSVTNADQAVMPLGTVIQRGQGLSGTIWETGKPVVIDRYENPVGEPATSKTLPIVAAVGVPITWGAAGARDEFLGTLVVKADPPRVFSSTDVDLLSLFATQAAIAIRNAQLYASLQQELAQRRRAEEALRESEDNLHRAGQIAHVGYWSRDVASGEIAWSDETRRIFGFEPQAMKLDLTTLPDYIHPEDRQMVSQAIHDAVTGIKSYDLEYRALRPDGMVRWVHSKGEVSYSEDGQPVRMFGVVLDITESKRAEETLRESEQQYRRLVESLPDIVWSFSDKRGTLYASTRVEAVLGYTPDYLYENPWLWNKSIHPDDQEHIGQAIADFAVGKGLDVEYRIKGAAGDWLWFRDRSIHRRVEGDETIIEGISTNITEHKWIEEELLESEKRFRQMAEHSRDVFWLRDLESLELLYITPAYERLWGQSIEDAYKKPKAWLMHVHPEDRDRLTFAFERQARGEPTDSEYRIVWPDGSVHWLRDRVTPVLNEAGEAYRTFGVMENITERVKAEEALRRRNRELVLLNRAGQAFSSTLDLEEVLVAVLEEVRNLLNVIACSIWILDPETGELVCQQATGPQSEVVRGWRLAPGQGIAGSTVARGESLIVPDTHADARYFAGVDQQTGLALRSVLSVPLRVKEEVIGVLQAMDTAVGYFNAGNLALLEPLAATAATHIENVRLYEQVRRYAEELERRVAARTRDLSTLYEVTAAANESLDLEAALVRALEHVLAAMQSTVGGIYLVDEADVPSGEETLRLVVEQGLPSALAAQLETAQSGHGLVGWVFEHGEPLLVPDISADPRVSGIPAPPLLAYVGVPIQVRGRPLGVLGVLKGENQPPFNIEEITLLTSIADHMGIVVESARLRQQVEQAAVLEERERLARELHDSITQSLYGLTLFARWARDLCEEGDLEAVKQRVVRIGETAQQALKEMRLLVYELRPELLEQDGLVGALRRRLEAVEKRAGVEVYLKAGPLGELPAPVKEGLYRIAQEALNNALKHASASSVTVRIEADDEQVALEIEDDGTGLVPDAVDDQGGLGLVSMQERAQKLGGTLTILSEPGKGTTVRVRLGVGKSFQERGPAH